MGLRYASVRQPIAVVMAPALTETSQPQGFTLNPGSLSSPVSFITFDDSAKNNTDIKCLKRLDFLNTNTSCVMNEESENPSDLKSMPTSQDESPKSKTRLGVNKSPGHGEQTITAKESDYSLLQIGGFMMNNSCPIEVDVDKMGLQKSSSSIEPCNYLKMDLFKNVGSNNSLQADLGAAGDIGHNVDEIMQVIKNMECKNNVGEENLEASLHLNDGADIAGGLSNFEREFFNDVDMINICEDENLSENGLAVNKDNAMKVKGEVALDRQFKIHRKCDWIKRRLYKLQMRAMGKHVSEEITSTLHHLNNMLSSISSSSNASTLYSALTSGKTDKEKVIESNFNLSSLVRRLDQSSQQQTLATLQHHVPCKYFGSGTSDSTSLSSKQSYPLSGSVLPKLNCDVLDEMKNKAGKLCHQLKVTEVSMDSDVTASSSGGESCDEMLCFNNPQQLSLPITKRASWKWAQDRSTIASKWSWLQAQISDLEYRIRQTNELNKKIRTGKGGVTLGGEDPSRPCRSDSDSVVVNGYHGSLPGASGKIDEEDATTESSCRTRPLRRTSFLKRKLLRTAGLHLTSKKAAKQSTVLCGCQVPLPSCAMCTGRPNPTQPHEDLDLLTLNERIALVDPAFHPVLSFQSDVSQSIHFDSIMKTTDWQLKAQRLQPKTPTLRTIDNSDDSASSEKRPLLEQQRRKYIKRSTTATVLTEKIKKKLAKERRSKMLGGARERLKKRRRFSSLSFRGLSGSEDKGGEMRHTDEDSNPDSFMSVSGATHPSPVPSPSPTPHFSKERDASRRKRENSYDIDNIVIPYSVAAATRLERLQYKEILTPKWRVLPVEQPVKLDPKNNGMVRRLSKEEEATEEDEIEDLTEEALISRHERSEQEEKKKFSTYLKLPNSLARSRSHRRSDSRAESSGGNTPDPMSPVAADGGGSPMTSPPATPQPADCELSQSRRRTISRCVSPADMLHDEVAPYELRVFPLSDDTYDNMLKVMPPGHPFKAYSSSHPNYSRDSESESRPMSPVSDSTESADTFIEEDPNDPEWTVRESAIERVPCKR